MVDWMAVLTVGLMVVLMGCKMVDWKVANLARMMVVPTVVMKVD